MCGLLGLVSFSDDVDARSLLGLMSHRGPDDCGIWNFENIVFGHHRLAIQDLSTSGHQPMSTHCGQVWIVFNGEIYNHLEIRGKLSGGYQYTGSSDTETVLQAYMAYGIDVLNHLNGIFAFAIYDNRSGQLFVARDQIGVKPLYYYVDTEKLAFASELKVLSQIESLDHAVAPTNLVDYVHFLWSPGVKTPYRHMFKLAPGHYFTYSPARPHDGIALTKYYELPYKGQRLEGSEQDLIEELDLLLRKAVDRQLLSDVPVGFFLSGGLDSSLIAAIAHSLTGDRFRCYTIQAQNDAKREGFTDDLKYAKRVAAHLDVDLHIVQGEADIMHDFDDMIWHLDEPQADPAPLHVRNICRRARQLGDIVLLGGTAGDDLFSGYRRHQAVRWEPYFRLIPKSLGIAICAATELIPSRFPMFRRVKKVARELGKTPHERMAGYYGWLDLFTNKSLFSGRLREELRAYDPASQLLDALHNIPDEHDPLNQMLYWDTKFFLADHNLNYTDKMSMAEGVEVRVPFLDVELVEFACKLPTALKLRGNTTKYLLKKVAERYLPHEVIYRPKTGFGAPVRQWVMEGRFDDRYAKIVEQAESSNSVYSQKGIEKLMVDTKAGRIDGAYAIWSVMAIDSWMKQFAGKC